ncbi:MAG: hypothetical protein CVU63_09565 [Deltaproteobacteria bacterium HGW-Deltaproteobacteria-20]|nr:MAG: hypothetical protein CVU63_09565 [Deltaproteobacteria bacterium HGW-Deltaproteobacteria-20]
MLALVAVLCSAIPARAQTDTTPRSNKVDATSVVEPRLHHGPVSTAAAGEAFTLQAQIDQPHLVRQAWLVFRSAEGTAMDQVAFLRASEGPYVAQVPGDKVRAPSFAYAIEVETVSGQRIPAFASRKAPFLVTVTPEYDDLREQAVLQRLEGRRSEITASSEYVMFGTTDATLTDANGLTRTEGVRDHYYRLESGYTYRPLRTVAEFSIRLGVVRGRSVVPGESDSSQFDVGLNYASPRVRFRFDDSIHLETELLTSVTEVGFSMGAGGALLIGDPYGTRLTFGFESVQTFGTRMYTRMDIDAGNGVLVAPIVEVTDMPHADRYGVRLLSEVGIDAGSGFRVAARGGYQARTFTSGGPSAGVSLSYGF